MRNSIYVSVMRMMKSEKNSEESSHSTSRFIFGPFAQSKQNYATFNTKYKKSFNVMKNIKKAIVFILMTQFDPS